MLSRIVLADVSGHGQGVGPLAVELRNLVHKHINTMDQSDLMRGINEAFSGPAGPGSQFATAAVLGYYSETGDLVFANAGHPPPLWYHASRGGWDWLREENPSEENAIEGLPLGLISGTQYLQTAVRLGEGDRLVLYTDGITECGNESGAELGYEGLISIARSLAPADASALGPALLSKVQAYSSAAGRLDDVTLLVLGD